MTGNNWSKVPTTLIELGYMSNPAEDRLMQTAAYQQRMIRGISKGHPYIFPEIEKGSPNHPIR